MAKNTKDITNLGGLWVYAIVVNLFTLLMLFGFRALENPDNLQKFLLYGAPLIIILVFATLDRILFNQFDLIYVHDPEKGIFSNFDMVSNPFKLFLLSLVIFTPIFLFTIITAQQSFVGFTQFQIAPIGEVWTAIEPAVITETLIVSVLAGIGWFFANKYKDKGLFLLIMGITLVATTGFMYMLHQFRYGGMDFSTYSVLIFFFITVLILQLCGSIIPIWVLHALNNGVGSAMSVFSSDLLIVFSVVIYISIVVAFVIVMAKSSKNGKWLA